jgi:hypothetical protein
MTRFILPVLTGLIVLAPAQAQAPALKFSWQKGQVLVYKVAHDSTVTDTAGQNKAETRTRLNLTKRWQVIDVESNGVATLQLTMPAMRFETTTPKGDKLLFDSADLPNSSPELRDVMSKFLNETLAVIRVDASGRVLELKESKQGGPNRFEVAPPFVAIVPQQSVQVGNFWDRNYNITLDPPQGTGEKFPATQHYVCKQSTPTAVVLQITTALKKEPEAVANRIPLLQSLPEGEVVFDPQTGRMRSAKMTIDKLLNGYQGEDSSYRFQSSYSEEYVGNK